MPPFFLKIYDADESGESCSDYWDKAMAKIYFKNPELFLGRILNSPPMTFLEKRIPDKGLILDAGCGFNYLAKILDSPTRKVIGVDFAKKNLLEGKKFYPRANSVAADLNALPFTSNLFDSVLCLSSAEHLEQGPYRFFQEAFRVLKAGGTFFLIIPTYQWEDRIRSFWVHRQAYTVFSPIPHFSGPKYFRNISRPYVENQPGFFAYFFSKRQVSDMLRLAGFHIEKTQWLDLLGGLKRSIFFCHWAEKTMKGFPVSTRRLRGDVLSWQDQLFMQEEVSGRFWLKWAHRLIGIWYHYLVGVIAVK